MSESATASSDAAPRSLPLLLLVVGLLVFLLSLSVSYLDEDAFISFRVVDNFVHGHGLRWNVDERVQVFTNPLWVLALIPLHAVLPDISWASFLLSAVASTAAVLIVGRRLTSEPRLLILGLLLPLMLSQSFTDYTNSGLENPFVYLFAALFAERLLRTEAGPFLPAGAQEPTPWLPLCLYAALSAVNRADTFLFYAPVLLWLFVRDLPRVRLGKIAWGAAPLLAWLAFALFYYGTIFPNPKYAKLSGGIDRSVYVDFGLSYFADVARNDPVTVAGLLVALGLATLGLTGRVLPGGGKVSRAAGLLAAGVVLYCCYVIYVGGDFMAGRHWAGPFFLAVVATALSLRGISTRFGARQLPPLLIAALLLLSLRFVVQPMSEQKHVIYPRAQKRYSIVRNGEIRYQRFNCGFYGPLFGSKGSAKKHSWSQDGLKQGRAARRFLKKHPEQRYVTIAGAAGKGPFYAGPEVHYIDPHGIADVLLARLPDSDGKIRLIGHLTRHQPKGYRTAKRTGELKDMDPDLRAYYEPLRLITAGSLWDAKRLSAIVAMNLGRYDASLRKYAEGGYRQERGRKKSKRRAKR